MTLRRMRTSAALRMRIRIRPTTFQPASDDRSVARGILYTGHILVSLRRQSVLQAAEAVLVGVSAAYWMVVAFWDVLVPNLMGKLWPAMIHGWPCLTERSRSSPKSLVSDSACARHHAALAFVAPRDMDCPLAPGLYHRTTAGLQLIAYLHGDFLAQIRNSNPSPGGYEHRCLRFLGVDQESLIVVGVLSCLCTSFSLLNTRDLSARQPRSGSGS